MSTQAFYAQGQVWQRGLINFAAEQEARAAQMEQLRRQVGGLGNYGSTQSKGDSMLDKLKNIAQTLAGEGSVEPLVELALHARLLGEEFANHGIPVPKWLLEAVVTLKNEIVARHRAEKMGKLRKLEKEIEELASKEEKRAKATEEAQKLREELGL